MSVGNARRTIALFAVICPLAACGTVGPVAPTADALSNTATPAVGTAWHITNVSTDRTPSALALNVSVSFAQTVATALPAPGTLPNPSQLGVMLLFSTGSSTLSVSPPLGVCAGTSPFPNVTYVLSPNPLADGQYEILNANGDRMGEASVSAALNRVALSVPLSAIGGGSGAVKIEVIVGNGLGPTDCAPDDAFVSTQRQAGASFPYSSPEVGPT